MHLRDETSLLSTYSMAILDLYILIYSQVSKNDDKNVAS